MIQLAFVCSRTEPLSVLQASHSPELRSLHRQGKYPHRKTIRIRGCPLVCCVCRLGAFNHRMAVVRLFWMFRNDKRDKRANSAAFGAFSASRKFGANHVLLLASLLRAVFLRCAVRWTQAARRRKVWHYPWQNTYSWGDLLPTARP